MWQKKWLPDFVFEHPRHETVQVCCGVGAAQASCVLVLPA